MPLEICIFQRPGLYTEGEAEGLRLSPRLGGATPLLLLSPRYISRKETAALGSGLKLQRHRPLSTTGARDHIGVDDGPKCENARDIIRANKKGAFAIPKGRRLKTHFPLCVTKAVLSLSLIHI